MQQRFAVALRPQAAAAGIRGPVRHRRGAEHRRPRDDPLGVVGRGAEQLRLVVVLLRSPAHVGPDRHRRVRGRVVGSTITAGSKAAPWLLVRRGRVVCGRARPRVGIYVDGSRRWLGAGMLRMQPSELAKLALLVVRRRHARAPQGSPAGRLAPWRARPRGARCVRGARDEGARPRLHDRARVDRVRGVDRRRRPHRSFGEARPVAGLGSRRSSPTPLRTAGRACSRSCIRGRTPTNTGYQITQSLIAFGSGGVNGVGLGAGRSKWLFLPNAHTDFIFAIIGEELGFVGCLLVLGLFAGFGLVGFHVARRAPDRFGALVAAGVTAWIVGQAVDQPRRGRGCVAGFGHHPAVPVRRWLVARDHDARCRNRREHRAPRRRGRPDPRSRRPAASRRDGCGPVRRERRGLRAARGRRDRWSHVSRDCRRAGAADSAVIRSFGSSVGAAGSKAVLFPKPGSRSTCCPAAGCSAAWPSRTSPRSPAPLPRCSRADRDRSPLPPAHRRWLRRLRLVAVRRRGPPLASARGGARTGRRARVGQSHRRAARCAPGGVVARHAAAGRPAHGESGAGEHRGREARNRRTILRCWRSTAARRARARSTAPRSVATTGGATAPISPCTTCAGRATSTSAAPSSTRQRRDGDALTYDLLGYDDRTWTSCFERATLAVCRSGAGTIAELTVAGVPAVLVPLPGAPSDHQTRNAQTLERAGAGGRAARRRVRPAPPRRSGDRAACRRPTGSSAMGEAARALGRPDAAARVADLVEEHARA